MKVSKPTLRSLSPPTKSVIQSPPQSNRTALQNKFNHQNVSPERQLITDRTFHSVKNQNEKKYGYSDKKYDIKGYSTSPQNTKKPKQPKKNQGAVENLDPGLPSQKVIVQGLRECTKVLKTLEKEYEYKIREKKTLQIVVDQLRKEVLIAQSQNQKFIPAHKKWENEAIKMEEAALNKESQREAIVENIEKLKEEVAHLDKTIAEDINKNREIVLQIHREKDIVSRLEKRVQKMRKSVTKMTKEKERMRIETSTYAKNAPLLQDRIRELVKDKESFVVSAHEAANKPVPKK